MLITSFIENITEFNGKAAVHTHISVATKDGFVHGGDLLKLFVGAYSGEVCAVLKKPYIFGE